MAIARKWFGPSREEIWKEFSSQRSAQYIPGSFWKEPKVQAIHGVWTITLDIYYVNTGKSSTPHTRVRAPFVSSDGFQFKIYRKGLFSDLGKRLGMQDIDIGSPDFDDDFIIKSKNESQARALFQNARIRELLTALPRVHFSVKDAVLWFGPKLRDDEDILEFRVLGVIKDVNQLRLIFDLVAETLDELHKIGSAYKSTPGTVL